MQCKPNLNDKPLLSVNTYFAKTKFSPVRKKKRDVSNDMKEQSLLMLQKQIKDMAKISLDNSKPTFLLAEKSTDNPKNNLNLVITTSEFRDSQVGKEYIQLTDKDHLNGIKHGAFKKKQTDVKLKNNKNSARLGKKKSIQKMFAIKNADNQTSGKTNGTEPTLTKKMPTKEDMMFHQIKFLTDSVALVNNQGVVNPRMLNTKFDQIKTQTDRNCNSKRRTNTNNSTDKTGAINSKRLKMSANKERKKNSVQLVRNNTQLKHQKTVSHNAIFSTKIIDLLKKKKLIEIEKQKNEVFKYNGIKTFNDFMNVAEMRRHTTQKTETRINTPSQARFKTGGTVSLDKKARSKNYSVAKKVNKSKQKNTKDIKEDNAFKNRTKSKNSKILSNNIGFTRSTTNLRAVTIDGNHVDKKKRIQQNDFITNDMLLPKFSIRKGYNRSKTNVSEPTSRLTSIDKTAAKKKKNLSKEKSSKTSVRVKPKDKAILQFINNIDSNQYLESLKAKLSSDVGNSKRQINLRSKLSLHNSKLLTLIGKFNDTDKNQEAKVKYKTCNNSRAGQEK